MPECVPVSWEMVLLLKLLDHIPISSCRIREWTRCDPVLSKVYQLMLYGLPHHVQEVRLWPDLSQKVELTIEGGRDLQVNGVIVPWAQGWAQVLVKLYKSHPDISRMKTLAHGYVIRSPQRKHLSTHGSGPVNCNHKCILNMQGHARTTYVFRGNQCKLFQMDGCPHYAYYHHCKVEGNLCKPCTPRNPCHWQWSKIHRMEFANFLAKPQMDKQSELLKTRTNGWALGAFKEGMEKVKEGDIVTFSTQIPNHTTLTTGSHELSWWWRGGWRPN